MATKLNITGQKFNKLKAIEEIKERTSNGGVLWKFLCDCGKESIHEGARVKRGDIISCGCSRRVKNEHESLIKNMYRDYESSAKTRNIDFNLHFDEFKKLTQSNCYYCGVKPEIRIRKHKGVANGVDRIDSNLGYELDNIRSCCKICNMAKSNLSDEEFYQWRHRIAKQLMEDNEL